MLKRNVDVRPNATDYENSENFPIRKIGTFFCFYNFNFKIDKRIVTEKRLSNNHDKNFFFRHQIITPLLRIF